MKIAVEGCAHGELENIYDTISFLESKNNIKIDLLLCCGDFQASRNYADLESMAVPPKYRQLCTFYKYYSGEKIAPILTIIIGGNHEASNYFQELAYGGWVAPNIYYLGYAGVVDVAGIRIAGLSGIFKSKDYFKGRFEMVPYSEQTKRSCYHVRALDVFRLKQISQPLHIMMSHDWPEGVYNYGNINNLLRKKPYFKNEVESNTLGSQPASELLSHLKPVHWFSAHLHVKFSALVKHDDDTCTKFLALDKCLPKRQFLQILDIPHNGEISLSYDLEWLTILQLTDHLTSITQSPSYMPGSGCGKRWKFTPTEAEKEVVKNMLQGNLSVPINFVQTAPAHDSSSSQSCLSIKPNPQTTDFCKFVGIDDPLVLLLKKTNPKDDLYLDDSQHNYSSFQMSGEHLNASFNTPVKQNPPRTPLQLPAPRSSPPITPSTPLNLPYPLSSSSPQSIELEGTLLHNINSVRTPLDSDNLNDSVASTPVPPTPPHSSEEQKQSEEVSIIIDTDGSKVEPPETKRFRRRNFAIYSTTED